MCVSYRSKQRMKRKKMDPWTKKSFLFSSFLPISIFLSFSLPPPPLLSLCVCLCLFFFLPFALPQNQLEYTVVKMKFAQVSHFIKTDISLQWSLGMLQSSLSLSSPSSASVASRHCQWLYAFYIVYTKASIHFGSTTI